MIYWVMLLEIWYARMKTIDFIQSNGHQWNWGWGGEITSFHLYFRNINQAKFINYSGNLKMR